MAVPPAGTTPDAAVPRELCASRDVTMHVKISSTNQNRVKLRAGFFTKIEVRSNRIEIRSNGVNRFTPEALVLYGLEYMYGADGY